MALSASYTGKRSACAMKQVGLNVALDPVMSSAYIGVVGGFIIVSADDPGPHSSQTEQDSRLLAHFAKLPVFDPESPSHARDLVEPAFELSERFQIPVMLRPTLRVCHGRENIELREPVNLNRVAEFKKDPFRWAAIPKMRLALHEALNKKLEAIDSRRGRGLTVWILWRRRPNRAPTWASWPRVSPPRWLATCCTNSGWMWPTAPSLSCRRRFPFRCPRGRSSGSWNAARNVLVLEETEPVLEMLAAGAGKNSGAA